jgi:hypothetical protein
MTELDENISHVEQSSLAVLWKAAISTIPIIHYADLLHITM